MENNEEKISSELTALMKKFNEDEDKKKLNFSQIIQIFI